MKIKTLKEMGEALGVSIGDNNSVLVTSEHMLAVGKTKTGLLIAECDPVEAKEIMEALGIEGEILFYT